MLKGQAKTDYQREYMRKKRAGEPTTKPKPEPAKAAGKNGSACAINWETYQEDGEADAKARGRAADWQEVDQSEQSPGIDAWVQALLEKPSEERATALHQVMLDLDLSLSSMDWAHERFRQQVAEQPEATAPIKARGRSAASARRSVGR
jgi:hypothetical protein